MLPLCSLSLFLSLAYASGHDGYGDRESHMRPTLATLPPEAVYRELQGLKDCYYCNY